MNFNPLTSVMIGIAAFMWVFTHLFRPSIPPPSPVTQGNQVVVIGEDQGLDLRALLAVVRDARDAGDLEERINSPQGINNLDLDGDGDVDFIRVSEFGDRSSGEYGFSFTVETKSGDIQEVATVEITPKDDQVEVSAYGNESLYGSGRGYSSVFPMASFFLMGYLLNSSSFYSSPYGYSRYPSYYSPFSTAAPSEFTRRTSRFRSGFSSSATRGPAMRSSFSGQTRRGLRNSRGFQKGFGNFRGRQGRGGFGGFGQTRSGRSVFGSGFGRNRGLGGLTTRRSLGGLRGFRGFRGFRR